MCSSLFKYRPMLRSFCETDHFTKSASIAQFVKWELALSQDWVWISLTLILYGKKYEY